MQQNKKKCRTRKTNLYNVTIGRKFSKNVGKGNQFSKNVAKEQKCSKGKITKNVGKGKKFSKNVAKGICAYLNLTYDNTDIVCCLH